jgi:UDP-glucose 4-epimerase
VDLCQAHLLALEQLERSGLSAAYNLGNSRGYSVSEVIRTAERVTGRPVPVERAPRREGDPAVLVADSTRALRELGWQPRFNDLETIISHAWQWEQKKPPTGVSDRRQA